MASATNVEGIWDLLWSLVDRLGPEYRPILWWILAGLLLLVVLGVLLPAVWSRDPARRSSALEVLRALLRR